MSLRQSDHFCLGCDVPGAPAWLAGTHDIGKISPAFAVQQATLADAMHLAGFAIPQNLAGTEERRRVRHETVSHMALIEWLQNRHEFSWSEAEQYAAILGAHHGRAPTQLKINEALDCRHLSGMIVEAPMGLGKTEAALLSTEIFSAHFALDGVVTP